MSQLILRNALIVTMNEKGDVFSGDILVNNDRIADVAPHIRVPGVAVFNAQDLLVLPGFVQTHIHLCQTLFRNLADDLSLLDWLRQKIWPYEAAHIPETLRLSARLGLAELIRCGTTCIMDMGTVHHQDVIFEELSTSGMRAFAGKTMMDYGRSVPALEESTKFSLDESNRLQKKWDGFDNGRLRYAYAPRFALSCSEELLQEVTRLCRSHNTRFHTHASENRQEIELVHKRFGKRNIEVFEGLGAAADNLCLAHCIWLDEAEKEIMRERGVHVLHCPSSNLKLASGIAAIPELQKMGINVSLGADGAPCNNNLNIFREMRLAALIQKPQHGADCMPAEQVVRMATIAGAKALGLEGETGSIESGKKADLTFLKLNQVHSIPFDNVYSKIVYSASAHDVSHVMINGTWVMQDRKLLTIDEAAIYRDIEKSVRAVTGT